MTLRTTLRRIFSWDAQAGSARNARGEDARAADTFRAQVDGRSSGSDTGYTQRFTR
jgi:hypothetical protein